MNLEEFVFQSLTQIMSGVKKAQLEHGKKNPGPMSSARLVTHDDGSRINPNPEEIPGDIKPEKVEFDLSITLSKEKESGVGIGVIVTPIKLNWMGKQKSMDGTTHRIKFSVPILWATKPDNS